MNPKQIVSVFVPALAVVGVVIVALFGGEGAQSIVAPLLALAGGSALVPRIGEK